MKYRELTSFNEEELDKKLSELQMELMKLNSQVATGTTPKSTKQINQLKKTIAKIYTVKNSKKENKKTKK
jgi:ribosomal protein L29